MNATERDILRAKLIDLAGVVAPELQERPLYCVFTSEADIDLTDAACWGLVGRLTDLFLKPAIGDRWRGRGWGILLKDDGRSEDAITRTWIHELSHTLDGTIAPDHREFQEHNVAIVRPEFVACACSPAAAATIIADHGPAFHRALAHLRHRAIERAGMQIPYTNSDLGAVSHTHFSFLSHALGRELEQCRDWSFALIVAEPMPEQFTELWIAGEQKRRRFEAMEYSPPLTPEVTTQAGDDAGQTGDAMSLLASITAAFTKKKTSAVEEYRAALRTKNAERIAEAASAAGIEPAQIADDIDVLDRAAALAVEVNKLPALHKATASAMSAYEEAAKALDAAMAKLQPAVDRAVYAAQQADAQEKGCRATVRELANLYHDSPELLDAAASPAAVRDFWNAEAARISSNDAIQAAGQRIKKAEAALLDARDKAADLVGGWGRTMRHHESSDLQNPDTIENAQHNVKDAQRELDKAIAAAEKLRA